MIVTSPASECSSAAESVVLDDGTVQVVPEHPVRSADPPSPTFGNSSAEVLDKVVHASCAS